ncbi:MAG: hypothetical protein Q4E05_01690 [Pseudoclavibacter sp.]|nr:hypothetical protein [Pseudoclavibacter sp.]
MTRTMKALVAAPGLVEPQLRELPIPQPGAGEALVRVRAAAVNPADPFVLSGAAHEAFGLHGAVGLGYDLAGTVVATGSGVPAELTGRRVAGLHTDLASSSRGQAEYAVLPAGALAELPKGMDFEAAATVPLGALTAAQGLELLGPPNGRTLLVTGGAGSVGAYALWCAAHAGWRTTGLAREGDRDFVESLGAVWMSGPVPGRAFDAVFDAAALQERALAGVRDGGAFLGVLPPAPVRPVRGVRTAQVLVRADGAALARALRGHTLEGMPARIRLVEPLERAANAYAALRAGGRGRPVLRC